MENSMEILWKTRNRTTIWCNNPTTWHKGIHNWKRHMLWFLWPKLPKLCWIEVVRVGTLVFFLILGEMLSIFPTEDNVCCGFVICSFYYVEACSFYSCFLESFYHKQMLKFVKDFFCIYWDNICFFYLSICLCGVLHWLICRY